MKFLLPLVLSTAALVLLGGSSAEAAPRERRVPAEYPTIQAAIDAAVDGDTVRVAPGVYGESIRWDGKEIALIGAGPRATVLDPGAGPGGRCLTLENVPAPAEIRRLTCRNGEADTGGGILIRGGSPAMRELTLERNAATAGPGGGVRVEGGSVTVEGCAFVDNKAPDEAPAGQPGGGLYAGPSSRADVSASVFLRNSASRGGGMSLDEGSQGLVHGVTFEDNTGGLHVGIDGAVEVEGSAFLDNRARGGLEAPFLGSVRVSDSLFKGNEKEGRGGGMYARLGEVEVTRCVFQDNTGQMGGGLALVEGESRVSDSSFIGNQAGTNGGGLGIIIGGTRIERCAFIDNEAAGSGGGVSVSSDSHTAVQSSLFRGNHAGADGGGMAASSVYGVSWESCAFSDNTAGALGGGVSLRSFYEYATMVGSTLTRNVAGERGGGMAVHGGEGPLSILDSILWGNQPDQLWIEEAEPLLQVSVSYSDVQGGFPGAGNIDADPLFVNAGRGNLRLRPRSPARDAGLDNGALPATDITGNPRVSGPAPDMGAYELRVGPGRGAEDRGR